MISLSWKNLKKKKKVNPRAGNTNSYEEISTGRDSAKTRSRGKVDELPVLKLSFRNLQGSVMQIQLTSSFELRAYPATTDPDQRV